MASNAGTRTARWPAPVRRRRWPSARPGCVTTTPGARPATCIRWCARIRRPAASACSSTTPTALGFEGMTEEESRPLLDWLMGLGPSSRIHLPLSLAQGFAGVLGQPFSQTPCPARRLRSRAHHAPYSDRGRGAGVKRPKLCDSAFRRRPRSGERFVQRDLDHLEAVLAVEHVVDQVFFIQRGRRRLVNDLFIISVSCLY